MRDLTEEIGRATRATAVARAKIIEDLKAVVRFRGKLQNDNVYLWFDSDVVSWADIPSILIPTSRVGNAYRYEYITGLYVNKRDKLMIETGIEDENADWVYMSDLLDLYDAVKCIAEDEKGEFVISNGVVSLKET